MNKEKTPTPLNRREFLAGLGAACAAGMAGDLWAKDDKAARPKPADPLRDKDINLEVLPDTAAKGNLSDVEAAFYEKLADKKVRCGICFRQCEVAPDHRGWCGVRENKGGTYKMLVHGKAVAAHIDPIEKKPLYHYLPGTAALSLATAGCNFQCRFCQNWELSQAQPETLPAADLPPAKLVELAQAQQTPTIAFTYTEPTIAWEYAHDTAKAARAAGIGSVIISNGTLRDEPLKQLCAQLTAVKIDFKGFTDKFYRETCGGELKETLRAIELVHKLGTHLELVVLVIPTLNDAADDLKAMSKWIVEHVGPDVPVHFTRFTPMYKLKTLPPTPPASLERARDLARAAGIHYVYIGNLPFHEGNDTWCHKCGTRLIQRVGYLVKTNTIGADGACPKCSTAIPGVWKDPLAAKPAS